MLPQPPLPFLLFSPALKNELNVREDEEVTNKYDDDDEDVKDSDEEDEDDDDDEEVSASVFLVPVFDVIQIAAVNSVLLTVVRMT